MNMSCVTSKRTNTHLKHEYPNVVVTVNRARAAARYYRYVDAAVDVFDLANCVVPRFGKHPRRFWPEEAAMNTVYHNTDNYRRIT